MKESQITKINNNSSVYIIAEMSANHNQNKDDAIKIIHAAKKAGADAVKIQTYLPESLTIDCSNEYFQIKNTIWSGQSLFDLYKKAHMPFDWLDELKNESMKIGIDFFSTVFDVNGLRILESKANPLYKIASFELVDIPLIRSVAKCGKPMILSTGMASFDEIKEAVNCVRENGLKDIVLLKCVSSYPTSCEDVNLKTMLDIREKFNVIVGLSDHTIGNEVAIAAVALGAKVIEKHFTLSKSIEGPDTKFSMDPFEFSKMVEQIRSIERAMGTVRYGPTESEKNTLHFRRSLFAVKDIGKGEKLTQDNIRSIRPANGLPPKYYDTLLKKTAFCDIKKGTPLSWDLVSKD